MKKMTNKDKLKELEKIAEKLDIGKNREVVCFSCKKTIKFKNAITLTNKKTVTYLCKDCYRKLENSGLTKDQIEENALLKELDRYKQDPRIQPVPWTPVDIRWNPTSTTTTGGTYTVSEIENKFLKLENNYDDKTNTTSSN